MNIAVLGQAILIALLVLAAPLLFRRRTSGAKDFVQFHIWMNPHMTVLESHDVVERLENELAEEFPGTEVLIHVDPEGQVDEPGNPLAETDLLKDSR